MIIGWLMFSSFTAATGIYAAIAYTPTVITNPVFQGRRRRAAPARLVSALTATSLRTIGTNSDQAGVGRM